MTQLVRIPKLGTGLPKLGMASVPSELDMVSTAGK